MKETLNNTKRKMYREIQNHNLADAFLYLSESMFEKDRYTYEHSSRVTYYSSMIGKELNLPLRDMESLIIGAFFHDLGKMSIPEGVLHKQGPLSEKEWNFMKLHPEVSAKALKVIGCTDDIVSAALYHHERYDGSGYPQGLKGKEIPFLARVITVADSYDAMTTNRSYSGALSTEDALKELSSNKGIQFDPDLADVFIKIVQASSSVPKAG